MSQEQWDLAVKTIAKVVFDNGDELAKMAVDETRMGVYEDKVAKNKGKARVIYNNLRTKKSKGKIAKPVGVVGALTPTTNPIVTPMSNAMFALKCGNACIISPHERSRNCSTKTIELVNAELDKLGYPKNLIQVIDAEEKEIKQMLMSAVDVVVATGGMSMVRAAYSSGKPALGVGAGNVQCIVDKGVDYDDAVAKLIRGRSFDNGIICSGEQSAICPKADLDAIRESFKKANAHVVTDPKEIEAVTNVIFIDGKMNKDVIGQDPSFIAEKANIKIPEGTKVIVLPADESRGLLGKEKMCPVLTLYTYDEFDQAVQIAYDNLTMEGLGHSLSLHSNDEAHIAKVATTIPVSRFVLNQICASSAGGSFYNGLAPTNTLGCGSWGNNSISENVDYKHLMNVSQLARFMKDNKEPSDEELWG